MCSTRHAHKLIECRPRNRAYLTLCICELVFRLLALPLLAFETLWMCPLLKLVPLTARMNLLTSHKHRYNANKFNNTGTCHLLPFHSLFARAEHLSSFAVRFALVSHFASDIRKIEEYGTKHSNNNNINKMIRCQLIDLRLLFLLRLPLLFKSLLSSL